MKLQDLEHAARIIVEGGLVLYPAEGCYGIGCDPCQHAAVRRILHAKHRSWQHGLIVIGATMNQLFRYIDADPALLAPALVDWPGPHTWLMPARAGVSRWIRGHHDSIAIRLTDHSIARRLCLFARRGIVSTSANRHGLDPARTDAQARRVLGRRVDYVLSGAVGYLRNPTPIRDARTGAVVRNG